MVLAGTGHRPPKLGIGYDDLSFVTLRNFLSPHICSLKPTMVISGGALGFDQALAFAACSNGIPFTMALPFHNMESRWAYRSQEMFRFLVNKASRVVYSTDGDYDSRGYALRDHWMVDNADQIVTIYDETERKSGTGLTVRYAEKKKKPMTNLWDLWVDCRDETEGINPDLLIETYDEREERLYREIKGR